MTINLDLSKYSEQDLIELNHRIVSHLKALHQSKTYKSLAKFNVGDFVWFKDPNGGKIEGMVVRVNKKTITIHTNDHHQWNVHPGYVAHVAHVQKGDIRSSKNILPPLISNDNASNVIELPARQ